MADILASIGITLGALASLPQIVYSIRTGDVSTLDARSMALRVAAAGTWGAWAVIEDDRAILYSAIANAVVECILIVVKIML